MYKERNENLKSSPQESQASKMPGKDSARAKLIPLWTDSFLPSRRDEISSQKIRCTGGKGARFEGEEGKNQVTHR